MYDLIIIGAGLSGLSTALRCKSEDVSVLVLEKGDLPRHKVCGEYLSAEVLPLLESWGMNLSERPRVTRAMLSAPNGQHREIQLPLGGVGVSRYFLDESLHQLARQCGIDVHVREGVKKVRKEGSRRFKVETKSNNYAARWVVSCHGKAVGRHISTTTDSKRERYIGVKQYYAMDFPDDLVALHSFRGGYGGAVLVENGWVDMAFMLNQSLFTRYRNIDKVMRSVLYNNPWMKKLLTDGKPKWEQPMAVSNFILGRKPDNNGGALTAGDAYAMIPPASGNGMAMAIISGAMMGKQLQEAVRKNLSMEEVHKAYAREWKHFFKRRLWWGRHVQRFMEHPRAANVAMQIIKRSDALLRQTIRQTHGSPESVKQWI
jgi:flavin-dependent dehydrogenase